MDETHLKVKGHRVYLYRVVEKANRTVNFRSSKYLNNHIEQDHRRIKQRVQPMLGVRRFEPPTVTLRGIELAEKIKKGQFTFPEPTGKIVTLPVVWAMVPAA